jgi:hypothetical protein
MPFRCHSRRRCARLRRRSSVPGSGDGGPSRSPRHGGHDHRAHD